MHPAVLSIAHLFESSNIERFDWDKYGRVLEVVVREHGLAVEEIEAVSSPSFYLLIVWKDGHVLANERGVFNKRIEIASMVPYGGQVRVVRGQKGINAISESLIEGFNGYAEPLFELSWGCGGPVSPSDAAAERDRVFAIVERLTNGATGSRT